jgi:hypothetical protein
MTSRNQESQQGCDFSFLPLKNWLPAIGGSYAEREIAIVEKYWTTNSLALSLKVSLWRAVREAHVLTVELLRTAPSGRSSKSAQKSEFESR